MSDRYFVDTNILMYAHDTSAGVEHERAKTLVLELWRDRTGTSSEQHVAAYWLAQLLVRSIPPLSIDTVVTEVSFQTERLGWQTDDF